MMANILSHSVMGFVQKNQPLSSQAERETYEPDVQAVMAETHCK